MKISRRILYSLCALMAGFLVLFLSMARVGLEIMAQENNEGKLRVNPVSFVLKSNDGSDEMITYKLPQTGILPDHPLYPFKRLRDWLWITFSSNPKNKSKIILFLADKKIGESIKLFKSQKTDLALETGNEAIEKLRQTGVIISKIPTKDDDTKSMCQQIFRAGQTYITILEKAKDDFDVSDQKFQKLITEARSLNEEQEKETENN